LASSAAARRSGTRRPWKAWKVSCRRDQVILSFAHDQLPRQSIGATAHARRQTVAQLGVELDFGILAREQRGDSALADEHGEVLRRARTARRWR
jgi:hypothetical protein